MSQAFYDRLTNILAAVILVGVVCAIIFAFPFVKYKCDTCEGKANYHHYVEVTLDDAKHLYAEDRLCIRDDSTLAGYQYYMTSGSTFVIMQYRDYEALYDFIDSRRQLPTEAFMQGA